MGMGERRAKREKVNIRFGYENGIEPLICLEKSPDAFNSDTYMNFLKSFSTAAVDPLRDARPFPNLSMPRTRTL